MKKKDLVALALALRREMDLTPHDRFDPLALAELYGVQVLCLSELGCSPSPLEHLQTTRPEVFSGALIPFDDGSTVIVENDAHVPERRASTASHEMAHVVLEHPFAPALSDGKGCRLTNRELEAEANELAGELLLPTAAARQLAYDRVSDAVAAQRFGVSIQFAAWRLNSTGSRLIAARAHAKKGR